MKRIATTTVRALSAVLLAALVAAGCGSVTKADFAKDVNAVCRKHVDNLEEASRGLTGSSPKESQANLRKVMPKLKDFQQELGEVELPSNEAAQKDAKAWLAGVDQLIGAFDEISTLDTTDQQAGARVFNDLLTAAGETSKYEAELGLDDCSGGGGGGGAAPPDGGAAPPDGAGAPPGGAPPTEAPPG